MVKIGIVGCGYWGLNLVRNFADARGGSVAVLCDADEKSLAKAKRFAPDAALTRSFDDALGSDVDALVLATPAAAHATMAIAALRAGKHVFVEKPLATTARDAARVVDLAEARGLTLMVGHTFLYNAAVLQIRDRIKSGEIGDVYYIYQQRLNLGKVRDDVNVMWNLAPHDISIVLCWLDEMPTAVSAKGLTFLQDSIEDVVFASLDFAGGRSAHIHNSWLDPSKVRRATIVGSKKMILYDDMNPDAMIQLFDKGIDRKHLDRNLGEFDSFAKFQLIHRAGDLVVPRVNFVEPLRVEAEHFIECVAKGARPTTDGEHGLAVVRILEALQKSLKGGGKSVKIRWNA
ncbi:MAG: Gfo/Idh/MocA family protein [bacterium]